MLKLVANFYILFFLFTSAYTQEKEAVTKPKERIERFTKLQNSSYRLGDYKNFKLYTDSILAIAKANKFKEYEIDALTRLGIYYQKIDAYDTSIDYHTKALELAKDIPESYKRETVILINLGNVYNQIGHSKQATESFKKAFKYIEERGGSDMYRMAVYTGFSDVAFNKKKFKTSLEYLGKAKAIGEKLQRNDVIINALNGMAECFIELQQFEEALTHAQEADALYDSKQSIEFRTLTYYYIGTSLVGLQRYEEAIQPLQIAQGMALSNQFLKIGMNANKQLAVAFEKTGDLEKANLQQKGYILAKEKYLRTLSKAKRLEVEKELAETEVQLKEETTSKWTSIIIGVTVVFLLLGVLWVYRKKKKQAEWAALQLERDRLLLEDENEALKAKILKFAQEKATSSPSKSNDEKSKKISITPDEQEKYIHQIVEYMEKEKPYLDHEIKQSTLAENLNMRVHLFSEVLNFCFGKNFNNFINLYRVDEAKQLIKNPEYSNYKILAIGYEAGFPSKTSFNRVFKQLVGLTPSEYRQQQLAVNT
ncbi:hypothetical protein MHTCC0001_31880 [Flavobacteriaceae bacterium MHTCC 0001]